jgi:hypothetical protein
MQSLIDNKSKLKIIMNVEIGKSYKMKRLPKIDIYSSFINNLEYKIYEEEKRIQFLGVDTGIFILINR